MRHTEVFVGRIGRIDEQPKELGNGNCVVNFSVAETPRVKQGNDWVDGDTIWTNVAIFGDEGRNLIRSVKPGTFVMVSGTRRASKYVDKTTKEERFSQSITAEQVAVAVTKFNYIEGVGNVNYAEEGRTGGAPAQKTGPAATDVFADANAVDTDDAFANEDPFDLL